MQPIENLREWMVARQETAFHSGIKMNKKSLTSCVCLCYSYLANGSLGFFFMPKNWRFSQDCQRKKDKSEVESCARKNHIGMYGVQAA